MAIVPQQPPQPPRAMTDAERDNALYYHENRLDDLNGRYVPGLQATLNALVDWAENVQKDLRRRGIPVPDPPPNRTTF